MSPSLLKLRQDRNEFLPHGSVDLPKDYVTSIPVDLEAVVVSDFVVPYVFVSDPQDSLSSEPAPLNGIWVNVSVLSFFKVGHTGPADEPPPSPFPSTRLATTTPQNSTAFYLYHQINGTTLVEDVWDITPGVWTSSTFFILEVN